MISFHSRARIYVRYTARFHLNFYSGSNKPYPLTWENVGIPHAAAPEWFSLSTTAKGSQLLPFSLSGILQLLFPSSLFLFVFPQYRPNRNFCQYHYDSLTKK